MKTNGNIVSFYGTDGSGKSSIAKEFARLDTSNEHIIIGGSTYKDWLTPDVIKNTLGAGYEFIEAFSNTSEMIRQYEDIAIACYGLARHMADNGVNVTIDSDPYLKRIIWETLYLPDDEGRAYVERFDERMAHRLGASAASDYIIGVNVQPSDISHQDLLGRLDSRSDNSDHDPTDIVQMEQLNDQVIKIWNEITAVSKNESSYPCLNTRLGGVALLSINNPNCPPVRIEQQTHILAEYVDKKINNDTVY